jgi:hypothetical protein
VLSKHIRIFLSHFSYLFDSLVSWAVTTTYKKESSRYLSFFHIFLFLLIGVHSIINHSFFLFLFINVKCLFFHLHIFKINRITLYTTGVTQFLQAIDRRSTYSGRGVWARTFAKWTIHPVYASRGDPTTKFSITLACEGSRELLGNGSPGSSWVFFWRNGKTTLARMSLRNLTLPIIDTLDRLLDLITRWTRKYKNVRCVECRGTKIFRGFFKR